ncbi:MAG: 2-oxoglutarate dehydrogenase complex dihydrolipoyllysine-residue succinyltransferase [Bacteroidales bacterium]|nr:2-oxoglutarate dehydrogenase complex dihydrolipoyllysine-residue succinyltransferase [Bacteroidales bacterium]
MSIIEIKVPSPGESITEVQLANWLVADGEYVEKNQEIAEIDSDKATLSIAAEVSGIIRHKVEEGQTIEVNTVVAVIEEAEAAAAKPAKPQAKAEPVQTKAEPQAAAKEPIKPEAASPAIVAEAVAQTKQELNISPLARKLMEEENLSETQLLEIVRQYRFSKTDIQFFNSQQTGTPVTPPSVVASTAPSWSGSRLSEKKRMSTLRKKVSERLVSVKNETAMLTTFNEVNMTAIIDLRNKYKETFKSKHQIGLGFMSFFTKAVTEALRWFPQVNAQIDGDDIVSFDFVDISIAVSGPKGLVVPVIRNAETLSLAQIEHAVKELATKARENKLTLDEMSGGTFTITNGGVFGSMMSTPIINPPQSAILGMHNIVERPIAVNGKVEIHPMMYIALSYDHRIIDGRESVGFLVKVKEMLENPARMLFAAQDPMEVLLDL